jgi:hypothetical protein
MTIEKDAGEFESPNEYVFDAIGAANATIFSVLHLASGFWQIPMDPATRHKAAFIT